MAQDKTKIINNIKPTNFIARHCVIVNKPKIIDTDTLCCMCGKEIKKGITKKDAIKDSFTDYDYLRYTTDYLCLDCYTCMNLVRIPDGREIELRKYHYLVTENALQILPKKDIENIIFNIPSIPFILAVSYNQKKHTSFKSLVNYDKNNYIITTDTGFIFIDIDKLKLVYHIVKKMYSLIPDAKQEITYFTKQEILTGVTTNNKILKYGIQDFVKDNAILNKYRGQDWFNFLIFILNNK